MSYILVDAIVAAVSIGNAGVPAILYEVFIASVIFMVLPPSLMARLSVLLPGTGSGYGIVGPGNIRKNASSRRPQPSETV